MEHQNTYAVQLPIPAELIQRKKLKGKRIQLDWYAGSDSEVYFYMAKNVQELADILADQVEAQQLKDEEQQKALKQMSNPKNWQLVNTKTLESLPFMNEVKNYTEMASYGRKILQQLAHQEIPLSDIKGLAFVTAKHFLQQYVIEPMRILKVALDVAKGESKDMSEAQQKILAEDDNMKDRLREKLREGKDYNDAMTQIFKEKEQELEQDHMRA